MESGFLFQGFRELWVGSTFSRNGVPGKDLMIGHRGPNQPLPGSYLRQIRYTSYCQMGREFMFILSSIYSHGVLTQKREKEKEEKRERGGEGRGRGWGG